MSLDINNIQQEDMKKALFNYIERIREDYKKWTFSGKSKPGEDTVKDEMTEKDHKDLRAEIFKNQQWTEDYLC